MIVVDRSRNYTMSISRPRPRTNIFVNLERRDEFTVAIIQNTANSNNKDLWQIENVRQTWKYHPKTFTPPRFVQFCSKRTKQNSLFPKFCSTFQFTWVDAHVRDAILSKKCSFFEHCSKGLWPPPPFIWTFVLFCRGCFLKRVFEH